MSDKLEELKSFTKFVTATNDARAADAGIQDYPPSFYDLWMQAHLASLDRHRESIKTAEWLMKTDRRLLQRNSSEVEQSAHNR